MLRETHLFLFIDTELILIDCRNENEFTQSHVKQAVLLNNNPLMVKRFLKGTKQLSDLLLVSENANEIVERMGNTLTIFYDGGNIQGSMKDILNHLVTKKNLNVKAMEGIVHVRFLICRPSIKFVDQKSLLSLVILFSCYQPANMCDIFYPISGYQPVHVFDG